MNRNLMFLLTGVLAARTSAIWGIGWAWLGIAVVLVVLYNQMNDDEMTCLTWKKKYDALLQKKRYISVCFPAMNTPKEHMYRTTLELVCDGADSDDFVYMRVAPVDANDNRTGNPRGIHLCDLSNDNQKMTYAGAPTWKHIKGTPYVTLLDQVYKIEQKQPV